MTELLTAAQMRAIEKAAIDSGEVTGLELMERAGRGVVEAVFEEWPELGESAGGFPPPDPRGYLGTGERVRRAVVLCGPGNNGGDGFVVARLLKERGWEVEVFLYGEPEKLPPDARVNYERWRGMGEVRPLPDGLTDDVNRIREDVSLYVDALFGIGLTRQFTAAPIMQDDLNHICMARRRSGVGPAVVAIDVPSGLDADTGSYPGYVHADPTEDCMVANLTVTFHRAKHGHMRSWGPVACGKVVVKDIGLEPWHLHAGVPE